MKNLIFIVQTAVLFGLFPQVHGQEKYKPPDLPKEELADLAFEGFSDVYVRTIDGLVVSSSFQFLPNRDKSLHIHVVPGIHLLMVQVESTQSLGGTGGSFWGVTFTPGSTTIKTEASVIQVDLKKGHHYVILPWYFNNANKVRFGFSAAPERNETAKIFEPDNVEKYPWLSNIFYEIYDATDLPDNRGTPDLSWVIIENWKWSYKENKTSIAETFKELDKQISSNPKDLWAHRQRGLAELWKTDIDYDKAIAEATKVIEINPLWARGYQERAWIWNARGNLDKELDDLNKAIEVNPGFTLALFIRGSVWSAKGDIDKAIADYTSAIETDACNIWSYHYRGNLWMQKGEFDNALADQNRAIEISPKFAPAYTARGIIWSKKQDYEKAIADYTAAIAIDLKFFLAYIGRAEALIAKKDYDKAIADYSLALKIDDRSKVAYAWRGISYQEKGVYDLAIADYTKALEIDPNLFQLYNRRGLVWFRKGDIDKAISDFLEASRLAPSDPWASEALAESFEKKGDHTQAADYYMKAGEMRIAQKDLNNAVTDFNLAIKVDPKLAKAFQQRAETYTQLGQYDMAITDYKQALVLIPGQTQWTQRLKELKTKK